LKEATRIWSKLAANAMRKATVDAVLDGYEKLVKATLQLRQAGMEEFEQDWDELAVNWLKAVKPVFIEAAKGGKKVRTKHSPEPNDYDLTDSIEPNRFLRTP